ncbi:phosphoribosylglycinamide formyltransferase [Microaerobacter geothermalis]|uniref:phosphoribosylglycinamide formyltransferase n=1 Tax=Microaerobacter geothermalis TaxID=674972 RepID=UPI001F31E715|nr:phosphoribosylglycinamide formyltransferase [Microaerobacter geothermalis]MCF6094484.1 phosphoribosylglycinamide formyltransferase [Microaerobacter geothermalis]
MKFAVFASGSGSNFQAIADAIKSGLLPGQLKLLICDRPGAFVLERANQAGIPSLLVDPKSYETKAEYEQFILSHLRKRDIQFVVLAGYMRLIGDTLLKEFEGRMINIHPSLLPSFAGKDAIGQALQYGVKVTGVTVHFVDQGMDTGPIIAQVPIFIEENETRESLTEKIHKTEHQLLIKVIGWLIQGRIRLNGRLVKIMDDEELKEAFK